MAQSIELFEASTSVKDSVEIEIFADEIKRFRNSQDETWLYLGILLVPTRKKDLLLKNLFAARKQVHCESEIKCHNLDKSTKRELAMKWV
jgi:hypothetical protein